MRDKMCSSCGSNVEGQRNHTCSIKTSLGWKQVSPRLYCNDFGSNLDCCTSCHEDQDMGYQMIDLDFPNDIFGVICCGIYRKMQDITSHEEFHP